jgi:2-polyprenyl-3-methyl-5-hydroxy-6-metoxy-1,4-benzoquinol methylase
MEPAHTVSSERDKYQQMWEVPQYRRYSPAEREAGPILKWLDKHACQHVLDFGCGTGRLALKLADEGYSVRMIDIAANCLDKRVQDNLGPALTFEQACLWSDEVTHIHGDAVICIDVLEHIPPDYVETVISTIRAAAPHGYCNAALYKDGFGQRIGKPLHLTVKPAAFWHSHFPYAQNIVRGNDAFMIW